jgi:5-methylcytosine-specific restriction protein A
VQFNTKRYVREALPIQAEFERDLATLLKAYSALSTRFPTSLIEADTALSSEDFSKAVEANLNTVSDNFDKQGPQLPPVRGKLSEREIFVRSPEITALALKRAKGICSLSKPDEAHHSFTWKKTGTNYVEAHHLIPFSRQIEYSSSLDVDENIVVLCPNCHRLLHHARPGDKQDLLKRLWRERKEGLTRRGLAIDFRKLRSLYDKLGEGD